MQRKKRASGAMAGKGNLNYHFPTKEHLLVESNNDLSRGKIYVHWNMKYA